MGPDTATSARKPVVNRALARLIAKNLRVRWSPEQIAGQHNAAGQAVRIRVSKRVAQAVTKLY